MNVLIDDIQPEVEAEFSPQKQAIVDAARGLFLKYGYEGLSIRDLAEHCGLAKATIYHHFRDKREIFLSVLSHGVMVMHQHIAEAVAAEQTPVDKLRAGVNAYCEMLVERRMFFLWSVRANAETEEQLRAFVHSHKDFFLGPLTEVLQEGIDTGVFRGIDAQMSVLCLFGMLNASMAYHIMSNETPDSSEIAARVLDLFLSGVSAKELK